MLCGAIEEEDHREMDYGEEIRGLRDASRGVSQQCLNLETPLNPHRRS